MNWLAYSLPTTPAALAYIFDLIISYSILIFFAILISFILYQAISFTIVDFVVSFIVYLIYHDYSWYNFLKKKKMLT